MNPDYRPDASFIKLLYKTYGKEAVDWYTRIPFYYMHFDTYQATKEFLKKKTFFDPVKYLPMDTWINFSLDPEIMNTLGYEETPDKQRLVLNNIIFRVDLVNDNKDVEVTILRTGFSRVKNKEYALSELVTGVFKVYPDKEEIGFRNFRLSKIDIEGTTWQNKASKAVNKKLSEIQTNRFYAFNTISKFITENRSYFISKQLELDAENIANEIDFPEFTVKSILDEINEQPEILLKRIMLFITLLAYAEHKKLSRVSVQRPTTKKDGKAKLSKPWTRKDLPSIIYLDALPRDPKPHQGGTHKSPIPYQVQPFNRVLRHERYGRNRGKIVRVKGHTRGGDIMSSEYRGQIYTVSPDWEYLKN